MICDKCFDKFKNEIKVKPEFKFISLLRYRTTTVRIVDGKIKDAVPTFKLILTVEKTLKNKNTKFVTDELMFSSLFCPNCGDKLDS